MFLSFVLCVVLVVTQAFGQPQINNNYASESPRDIRGDHTTGRSKRTALYLLRTVILRDVIQTFASRKRLLRVYQKEGGYPQAVRDFNTLRLNNVEDYGSLKIGYNSEVIGRLLNRPNMVELQVERIAKPKISDGEYMEVIKYIDD